MNQFIQTDSGNLINKTNTILASNNIILQGKTILNNNIIIRADLSTTNSTKISIIIGKYTTINSNVIIRPGYKLYKGVFSYYPIKIGDHVYIGEGSIIQAASIGNGVYIGSNCVIGALAIIKDYAHIADNSIVAPGAIIPSLVEWSGSPARWTRMLPEATPELVESNAKAHYTRFLADLNS